MKHLLFRTTKYSFAITAITISIAVAALAQTQVEVTRNVNLRRDASTTQDPITLLRPTERLELLEPDKLYGYYHVRTQEEQDGYVWAKNIRILSTSGNVPTAVAIAASVSPAWAKGTPSKTTFNGIEGPCPFNGNGFDSDQYTLKNRTDIPSSYHDVTWSAINNLPYPGKDDGNYGPKHRKDWTAAHLAVIQPFESIPVRVIGYVVAIKPQNGGSGEGTNCNFNKVGDVDAHIALVEKIGDAESSSIVIEWTPRFLSAHPNWKKSKLMPWLDSDNPVRISGWLMVDPDHVNHLGRYRGTLWEIHPITNIDVFKNGEWVDLDDLP